MSARRWLGNLSMWILCLSVGSIVGVLVIPIEAAISFLGLLSGAKGASWSEIGFALRQATDLRVLRDLYPLTREVPR